MKWTLRKTCKWFISHEVDLKKNHANGLYLMKWTLRKPAMHEWLQWVISHEVDLKKNLQMVHIS